MSVKGFKVAVLVGFVTMTMMLSCCSLVAGAL